MRDRVRMASVIPILLIFAGLVLSGSPARAETPPPVPREFRGVWISTVYNLDWPSRKGLSTEQQQRELIEILDAVQAMRMNAVMFQVRPEADALYDSPIEPWSANLTGTMGQAPDPYYDPLEFLIEHAHARGIQVHAWLNPYRASVNKNNPATDPRHVTIARPDLVREYDRYLWLDPASEDVQNLALRIVDDILQRYDIDGIQYDDYFYPYPRANPDGGGNLPFPDDDAWRAYQQGGGTLSRADWRRQNVDVFIRRTYDLIKERKPHVLFGVSPFGIWQPGHPQGIRGMNPYDAIFADSRKWLHEGWLDYFAPQLYWEIDPPGQSYPRLLDWWISENVKRRHIWPGIATYKIGEFSDGANEIVRQIELTQQRPGSTGTIHFRTMNLTRNPDGIRDKLNAGPYRIAAAIPPSPWLSTERPEAPLARLTPGGNAERRLEWQTRGEQQPWQWVVYAKVGDEWYIDLLPGHRRSVDLRAGRPLPSIMAVSAIDRFGNESPRAMVRPGG